MRRPEPRETEPATLEEWVAKRKAEGYDPDVTASIRKKCLRAPENIDLRAHHAEEAKAQDADGMVCAGCWTWFKRDGVFFIMQEDETGGCPLRDVFATERAAS